MKKVLLITICILTVTILAQRILAQRVIAQEQWRLIFLNKEEGCILVRLPFADLVTKTGLVSPSAKNCYVVNKNVSLSDLVYHLTEAGIRKKNAEGEYMLNSNYYYVWFSSDKLLKLQDEASSYGNCQNLTTELTNLTCNMSRRDRRALERYVVVALLGGADVLWIPIEDLPLFYCSVSKTSQCNKQAKDVTP